MIWQMEPLQQEGSDVIAAGGRGEVRAVCREDRGVVSQGFI